jgi:acyl carrier protein
MTTFYAGNRFWFARGRLPASRSDRAMHTGILSATIATIFLFSQEKRIHMDMRDQIKDYIVTKLIKNPKYKLGYDDKLISGGVIDSFSLVELGMFLEDTFGVRPDDTELNAENMDTVQMITNYVESHR